MPGLIKQVFIALLNFSESLATECLSLSNDSCKVRPTLFDLNPMELNFYPFRLIVDKCKGSFNAIDDLFTKIYVLSETKNANVKIFNMILTINELKALVKHIS